MFKDKLKGFREKYNISQGLLASKIKVRTEVISSWENGDSLPNMKQVKKLADVFYVDKEKLLDKDSYLEIAKNSDEPYSVKKRIIISVISIVVSIVAGSIYSGNYDSTEHYHSRSFFKSFLLDDYGLDGLKESEDVFNSKYNTSNYNNSSEINDMSYVADIDCKESFDEYAEYVFNFLLASPDVYYVSFVIDEPIGEHTINGSGNIFQYLLPSNDINDYYESYYFDDYSVINYYFHYFVDSSVNLDDEEKYDVKELCLSYVENNESSSSYSFRTETDPDYPDLFIRFRNRGYVDSVLKYYFASAKYSIREEIVSNDNFEDYFSYSSEDTDYGCKLTLVSKYTFATGDIELEADYELTSFNEELSIEYLTKYMNTRYGPIDSREYAAFFEDFETYSAESFVKIENTRLEVANTSKVYMFELLDWYS